MAEAFVQKNIIYGNFHENQRKKFLTHFVSHFWLIEDKD